MKQIILILVCLVQLSFAQGKKITELIEQTIPDSADVFPFVDISADTTKKISYYDLTNSRLQSLYALADSLINLRNDFNERTDSVLSIADELRVPNFRVIINDKVSFGTHGENIKTAFITGYESGGGTWSDSIQIQYDVSIVYSFLSADSNEADLIIDSKNLETISSMVLTAGGYYPTYLFKPAGSNSYIKVYDAAGNLPCIVSTGAGADTNITGYDIEFHGVDPIGGIYSSYSNGYIAGQLLYIADYLNVDLWTARYLARQTGHAWSTAQGYGKINIAACIAAYDSEINYQSLDLYR